MAKNIEVNLTFRADTAAAKKQIYDLQNTLSNIMVSTQTGNFSTKMIGEMKQVADTATKLKVVLQNSINVDTGKLNFGKFNQQMQKTGLNIRQVGLDLAKMGPEGVQAFAALTSQIKQSQTPLLQLEGQLKKLGTTFANTIRWQITSSITTGLYSAFTGVIDYSEKLNKSLNDIRIVTGKNTDTMATFAKNAQTAAKSLSTDTLDYTKASLIYYQQGLSDKEVQERTDTTVKLANVVGESADTVSEWMTSIWNNFDDGSRSLESYADVLAKLGAATASSADEIAGGLEKFSAVANTVGLSYDYAAAAVTTMTAATRQSEDVVGTSLKTIFARFEDLKLGKTLDDNVTLGQYSGELAKAGVNILDEKGNLKDMDTILDSIMSKWGTLSKAQQVSLAQSVAGVRQYSQFMSLIDNSDAFKQNVEWAKDSTGELKKQQEIYASGIEGAQARLETSVEYIKHSLLDENDLVPILNALEKFTTFVGYIVDSIGGIPGILAIIANYSLKIFGSEAAARLSSMTDNIKVFVNTFKGKTATDKQNMVNEAVETEGEIYASTDLNKSQSYEISRNEIGLREKYNQALEKADSTTKSILEMQMKLYEVGKQNLLSEEQRLEQLERERDLLALQSGVPLDTGVEIAQNAGLNEAFSHIDFQAMSDNRIGKIGMLQTTFRTDALTDEEVKASGPETDRYLTAANEFKTRTKNYLDTDTVKDIETAYKRVDKATKNYNNALETGDKNLKEYKKELNSAKNALNGKINAIKKNVKSLDELKELYPENTKAVEALYNKNLELAQAEGAVDVKATALKKTQEDMANSSNNIINSTAHWSTTLVNVTQNLAQVTQGVMLLTNGIDSMVDSFANSDFSFSQFVAGLSSMLFGITTLAGPFAELFGWLEKKRKLDAAQATQDKVSAAAKTTKVVVQEAENLADKEDIANSGKKIAAGKKEADQDKVSAMAKVAKLIAGNPLIGLAVLAIIGTLIGVSVASSIKTNQKEQKQEAADDAVSEATDTKSKADEHSETAKEYQSLLYQYQQTGEGQEKLAESAKKVVEAYELEGSAVSLLAENYEKLNKQIKEAQNQELEDVIRKSETAISKNNEFFIDAAKKDAPYELGDSIMYDTVSDVSDLSSAIKEADLTDEQKKLINYNEDTGYFAVKSASLESKDLYAYYEAIDKILKGLEETDQNEGDLYEDLAKTRNNMSEQADKYAQQYANAAESLLTEEVNKADIGSITNLEDFITKYKEIKSNMEQRGYELNENTFSSLLSSYADASQFNTVRVAAEEQAEQSKNLSQDALLKLYDKSSEAFAKALANVKVTEGDTIDTLIEKAQNELVEAEKSIALGTGGKYEKSNQEVETFAKILKDNNKQLQSSDRILYNVTSRSIELNEEFKNLVKTWSTYNDALMTGNTSTADYAYAVTNVAKSLKTLFGITNSDIDLSNFVRTNKELISTMMSGDATAFDTLQRKLGTYTAQALGYGDSLNGVLTTLSEKKYTFGENVDISAFEQTLNQMLADGEITSKQLEQIFNAQGFAVDFTVNKSGDAIVNKMWRNADPSVLSEQLKEQEKDRKKRLKQLKQEGDRYHQITQAIDDTTRALNRCQKQADRTFGRNRLKYMQLETQELKNQIANNEEKLRQAQQWYQEDRAEALKAGLNINDDGTLANYDAKDRDYIRRLKAAVNDEALTEKIQEEYDNFKQAASQYEETLNLMEFLNDELIDYRNELTDSAFEKIETEIEWKLDINDNDKKYINFLLDNLEDKSFSAAEKITLLGSSYALSKSDYEIAKQGYEQTLAEIERQGGEVSEKALSDLKNYRDQMISSFSDMKEAVTSAIDAYNTEWDEWIDKIDTSIKKLEYLTKITDNMNNIVDLVGRKRLGLTTEAIDKMYQARTKVAMDQLESNMAFLNSLNAQLADAEARQKEAAAKGLDTKVWDDQIKTLTEKIQDQNNVVLEGLASAIQASQEELNSFVENTLKDWEESITGIYGTFDELSTKLSNMNKIDDLYLDDFEKVYEISKLNRDINKTLSSSTITSSGSAKLKKLQSEILDMQKDGVNVSKSQMEYKQKEYDLLVAEENLRNAQNNKNTVRLQRDSEGNYGYVYTADQAAISDAQQKYDDAMYNLQSFVKEWDKTLGEQAIELNKWVSDRITEIMTNDKLTLEQKQELMKETMETYNQEYTALVDQYDWAQGENLRINQEYTAGLWDTYDETVLGKLFPEYTNFGQHGKGVMEKIQKASQALNDKIIANEITESAAIGSVSGSVGGFASTYEQAAGQIQGQSEQTRKKIVGDSSEMASAMQKVRDKEWEMWHGFELEQPAIRDEVQLTIDKIGKLEQSFKAAADALINLRGLQGESTSTGSSGNDDTARNDKKGSSSTANIDYSGNYAFQVDQYKGGLKNSKGETIGFYFTTNGLAFEKKDVTNSYTDMSNGAPGTTYINVKKDSIQKSARRVFQDKNPKTGQQYRLVSYGGVNDHDWTAYSSTSHFLGSDLDGGTVSAIKGSYYWYLTDDNCVERKMKGVYLIKAGAKRYVEPTGSFDTGGYTGSWGKEGRLAMLHQKELVLNADDTKNFLSAVSILRDINSQINLQVAAMRYSALTPATVSQQLNPQPIQQNVNINAEFPNATDHSEIEEAFNNLSNMASQYIMQR